MSIGLSNGDRAVPHQFLHLIETDTAPDQPRGKCMSPRIDTRVSRIAPLRFSSSNTCRHFDYGTHTLRLSRRNRADRPVQLANLLAGSQEGLKILENLHTAYRAESCRQVEGSSRCPSVRARTPSDFSRTGAKGPFCLASGFCRLAGLFQSNPQLSARFHIGVTQPDGQEEPNFTSGHERGLVSHLLGKHPVSVNFLSKIASKF